MGESCEETQSCWLVLGKPLSSFILWPWIAFIFSGPINYLLLSRNWDSCYSESWQHCLCEYERVSVHVCGFKPTFWCPFCLIGSADTPAHMLHGATHCHTLLLAYIARSHTLCTLKDIKVLFCFHSESWDVNSRTGWLTFKLCHFLGCNYRRISRGSLKGLFCYTSDPDLLYI